MKLFKFQSSLVLAAKDAEQANKLLSNIYKGSLVLRPLEITSESDLPFGIAKYQPYNGQSLYEDRKFG